MKKITEQQRVEQIFLSASPEDAQRYLAVAGAILMARFPQSVKVKATNHRKPRGPKVPIPVVQGPPVDRTTIKGTFGDLT